MEVRLQFFKSRLEYKLKLVIEQALNGADAVKQIEDLWSHEAWRQLSLYLILHSGKSAAVIAIASGIISNLFSGRMDR